MSLKTTVKGYSKLNLFLDITGVLPNGYHGINSVMQRLDLADIVTVELTDSGKTEIICSDPSIPCDERNIAYKACRLFSEYSGERISAKITIEKNIPTEAGMGGSSADGAAVLLALNELYSVFSRGYLEKIGAQIGADVPFCIRGGTAVCRGIGEEITTLPDFPDCYFLVVQPDIKCGTKTAYGIYDASPVPAREMEFQAFVKAFEEGSLKKLCGGMYNIFETLYGDSRLLSVSEELSSLGALKAMMTGSGSALFGIFADKATADVAFDKMTYRQKYLIKHCKSY